MVTSREQFQKEKKIVLKGGAGGGGGGSLVTSRREQCLERKKGVLTEETGAPWSPPEDNSVQKIEQL